MIESAENALSEIEKRGIFPAIFRQIYQGHIPLELVGSCAPPRQYFELAQDNVLLLPSAKNWLPLWESNSEEIVAFDIANENYIRHYYGTTDVETLGKSYQQFVSTFLLELVDSGIWNELDEVAEMFEYKHTDKLRRFVDSREGLNWQELNRRFVDSVSD